MEKEKKFARTLVTTALPYANGFLYLAHSLRPERESFRARMYCLWVVATSTVCP